MFAFIYFISYILIHLSLPQQISIWLFISFGFLTEFILVLISFSGLSYLIMRNMLGARYLSSREKNLLDPIIQDILYLAQTKIRGFDLNFNDIKIMIHDKKEAFTQSIGTDTIMVSDGLIKNFSEMEIKGALANEIAHLFYKEGQIFLTIYLGSIPLILANWIYSKYLKIWQLIKEYGLSLDKTGFIKTTCYVMLIPLIIFSPIIAITWIGFKLFDLSIIHLKRTREFKSDAFAKQLGLADGLIRFLETLSLIIETDNSVIGRLTNAHPAIMERIDRLERDV